MLSLDPIAAPEALLQVLRPDFPAGGRLLLERLPAVHCNVSPDRRQRVFRGLSDQPVGRREAVHRRRDRG
jgi:hypothetical protein